MATRGTNNLIPLIKINKTKSNTWCIVYNVISKATESETNGHTMSTNDAHWNVYPILKRPAPHTYTSFTLASPSPLLWYVTSFV
ncbi:Uncharacterized protein APZ42_002610 [Daphnia magna]|uniref:Uncharacterized protein n=1 Tax=Daphnia magna TaxID=35525 RepID=A0A164I5N2_9CRUS|nr:Uncharacterized protein APZ42_002610 [Daphnia magna]